MIRTWLDACRAHQMTYMNEQTHTQTTFEPTLNYNEGCR